MFPHLSFPASVVHHYHHYLTPLSLHRARLAKSQVSIKQSTYFCLHPCGLTFAEGKKHRACRWPLSSWNHELESHVGAQHLFNFHIAFLAFPLSQITISELFPPQSLHLFFPTLRCQLVTSLHTALKRKKICQRGTLNFPHSKMYDATCVYSYNLCLPFSYSGWNVFTPVKVKPSTRATVPIPYWLCSVFLPYFRFISVSWIISINTQTFCNVIYNFFLMPSWELHILLAAPFDSCMCRFSKCYTRLSLTFDPTTFQRFPKPLIPYIKSLSAWNIWSDFYFSFQILTDTCIKLHCLRTLLYHTFLGMLYFFPSSWLVTSFVIWFSP